MVKTIYRGKRWDIKSGIRYGDSRVMYYGIVLNDGKGIDSLHLDLEKAKERWTCLENIEGRKHEKGK